MLLAGAMGATAALGMVAAVVTSATRLDNCYGVFDGTPSSSPSPPSSSSDRPTSCEASPKSTCPPTKERAARLLRKQTTLVVANEAAAAAARSESDNTQNNSNESDGEKQRRTGFLQRLSTREEISKLRKKEKEMLKRWERDEEGWRELPARAWPAVQPKPEELKPIMAEIKLLGCLDSKSKSTKDYDGKGTRNIARKMEVQDEEDLCTQLLFDMATTLVFYSLDPEAGLNQYRRLATEHDHVDSMVACGIVLVEGLGVPPREEEGLSWLQRAADEGSAQGLYELGTLHYTGLDGVLDENPAKAFALFEQAAAQDHTAAMYMMADCLVEGDGTPRSVARAVPLFYKAAERGHRYSRQRIRELLARIDYPV